MVNDLIVGGSKVLIESVEHSFDKNEEKKKQKYESIFVEWNDASNILLEFPDEFEFASNIDIGNEYILSFFSEKGIYQCQGVVVSRLRKKGKIYTKINLLSNLERCQRRRFFRLEKNIELKYAVVPELAGICEKNKNIPLKITNDIIENDEENKYEYLNGITLDISGGGLRMNSSFRHEKNDILIIKLNFPDEFEQKIPRLFAHVIVSSEVGNKPGIFDNRVEFMNLSYYEKETLIRYIFMEEALKKRHEEALCG